MGFLDVLKKIAQIEQVAAPIAVTFFPPAAPILPIITTALQIVNSATNKGEIDDEAIGQLNALLVPHGLAVIKIPKAA